MFTAIIFDFFDVIRTDPTNKWLNQNGIKKSGNYAKLCMDLDMGKIHMDEFFKTLSDYSGLSERSIIEHYENTEVVDEITLQLVEGLKQKYKIGLLSNAPSKYLRNLLLEHSHDDLFDEVVISAEVKLAKPSSEAFNHIMRRLKSKPNQTIFVDDNIENVNAAEKLGITGIHFKSGAQLKSELKKLKVI
jgi:HAD superfamily hydrolase (TIGR01509 family)